MHDEFVVEGAGCKLDYSNRTGIMGILNITPDSFYDGGWYKDPDTAVDHALRLVDEAIHVGARIVNDVSGLTADPEMVETVASAGVPVVLMHTAGNPVDMQKNPSYKDTVGEIFNWLKTRIDYVVNNGIRRSQIIVDPGIGFGKRLNDNLLLLRSLVCFRELERPILVGPSRKSFIGSLLDVAENDRLEGTAAAVALGVANGASMVRVHDVKEMGRVVRVADAICRSRQG